MKQTLLLIFIGITIFLLSCNKNSDKYCDVSDPFTELPWLVKLNITESICISKALLKDKVTNRVVELFVFGPNVYTGNRICYYGCSGFQMCSYTEGDENTCEQRYEMIKITDTYCK